MSDIVTVERSGVMRITEHEEKPVSIPSIVAGWVGIVLGLTFLLFINALLVRQVLEAWGVLERVPYR
jgi:hypothetical protein